jgi:hypothetical protein
MSRGELTFLSSLRRGAATMAAADDSVSPRARLTVEVRFNGGTETASREVALHGPGEVTGLDARAVIRTWPTAGLGDAAPNDMALVEFDQADLPWRYTPVHVEPIGAAGKPVDPGDVANRLHPWIVLLVLREDEIDGYSPPSDARPLPVLSVRAALPDLEQSWAWAHVQVTGAGTLTDAEALKRLGTAPGMVVSRLLCPRRLEPRTAYRAFVVPSFERGRLRGLGRDPDDVTLGKYGAKSRQRAWTKAVGQSPPRELPVYYEWEFQTAIAGSDFESLVRRLTSTPLPPTVGTRSVDATAADPALPPLSTQPLPIEGALRNPNLRRTVSKPAETAEFVRPLTELLNRQSKLVLGLGTPDVGPPIYGRWLAGDDALADARTPVWLDALNRDPRNRISAGAGGAVVSKQEEKLLAAAWEQVDGLPAINEKLRFAQLSRELSLRVRGRWLAAANTEAFLTITAPAFARIRHGPQTLAWTIGNSRLARGPLEPAFRALTRPYGSLGRRVARVSPNALATLLSRMNDGQLTAVQARAAPSILVMSNTGSPESLGSAPRRPTFKVLTNIGPGIPLPVTKGLESGQSDSPDAATFRAAAVKMLGSMRVPAEAQMMPTIPLPSVRDAALATLDPSRTVVRSLAARLRVPEDVARAQVDALEPILASPTFDHPMYGPLRDLSAEWILPAFGDLPNDSASLAVVNPAFIESFMVGLNHEFGRSLLWRRYPIDQRRTFFRQFWDSSGYYGPRTVDQLRDIGTIDAWPASRKLGANGNRPRPSGGAEPLVLLVHGDLIQQFPRTVVYAARARTVDGRRDPVDPPEEMHPVFRGTLTGNFAFFGFDLSADEARGGPTAGDGWFFVLQEQPTEPRFGFDGRGRDQVPQRWSDLTWEHIAPAATPFIDIAHKAPVTNVTAEPGEPVVTWHPPKTSSADLAYIALRRPTRVAIHATAMMGAAL